MHSSCPACQGDGLLIYKAFAFADLLLACSCLLCPASSHALTLRDTHMHCRFEDPAGPQDTAGSWGMAAPSQVQQPGWDAYQQQASGVQLTSRRSYDP